MFLLYKIYFKILNIIIKIFTEIKIIPKYIIKKKYFDKKKVFIYILPYFSLINFIILRQTCLSYHLQDPLKKIKTKQKTLPTCIFLDNKKLKFFKLGKKFQKKEIKKLTKKYLNAFIKNKKKDFKIILVSIMFGRIPVKKEKKHLKIYKKIKKIFYFIWYRKNIFINFSQLISFKKIIKKNIKKKNFIKKTIRAIKIYYIREKLIVNGKKFSIKKISFKKSTIQKNKTKKLKKNIKKILNEISSNFSYEFIRITNYFLSIFFNILYEKIKVKNIKKIHNLAFKKKKIIYIPSHRSHIDYLILSYILYHNGLAPPYIAAGINLNFFPLGIIFRNLGAFFIRRSFTAQKIYSFVFKKYFIKLFKKIHSMEYFIEGKRSRTGKLSKPKTGMLSLISETIFKEKIEQVIIVPICISYDSILELQSYKDELSGKKKKKENILSIFKSLKKIKKLGNSYINFGKPIFIKNFYLKKIKKFNLNKINNKYPSYINFVTNILSIKIMTEINNSAIVNKINLCFIALLNSKNQILRENELIEQINCYFNLIKNIPYSKNIVLPQKKIKKPLNCILKLKEFCLIKIKSEKFFTISKKYKNLISYYQNNILHLLIIPSLIITILKYEKKIKIYKMKKKIKLIYPILKIEFYMNYSSNKLTSIINSGLNELQKQNLIFIKKEHIFLNKNINNGKKKILKNLSFILKSILIRYVIVFSFYQNSLKIKKNNNLKKTYLIAKKIYLLYKIKNIDFLNTETFLILTNYFFKKKENKRKIIFQNIVKIIPKNIYLYIKKLKKLYKNKIF